MQILIRTSFPRHLMNSISSAEKLAIDIDFTRCGGFKPLLFTTRTQWVLWQTLQAQHQTSVYQVTVDCKDNGKYDRTTAGIKVQLS